jgi:hypothetical protein
LTASTPAAATQMRWRREAELILCCAAASGPERLDRLRIIIDAGDDWEIVTRAALRHGVMPVVYRALTPALASHLPASVYARMRREVHGNAVRNCYLATEMLRLCRLLEKHGVRTLALKGPALAAGSYGDLTLRQFTDLDLLVRQNDLGATFAALAEEGFRTNAPLKRIASERSFGWEMTFVREPGLFELDLHWRLLPSYFPFTPEGDELWQRAVEVDLGPERASTPAPEDLMLFLCAHGAKHGWQSLGGVCDVAQAARAHQYDWEALASHARSLGNLRILLLGLLLAYDLLGAAIPDALVEAARTEPSVQRGARIFSRYFYQLGTNGPGLFQRWSIPLAMIPRRSACLRYALARAFLPAAKDFDFVILPFILSPLYYAVRPLRFVLQKTPNPVRFAIASSAQRETDNS